MKYYMLIITAAICALNVTGDLFAAESELDVAKNNPLKRSKEAGKKLGWELGLQVWTFGPYTLPEQFALAKGLDIDYLELGPQVEFEKGTKMSIYTLDEEYGKRLKMLIKETGIPFKQLYVHSRPSEEEWRKAFDFAKAWEVDTLVAEPLPEQYDLLEKLCKEYDIKVAVHNHPNENNRYWHPDKVLEQIKGRDKRLGFNPDLGHWMRMGVSPLEQFSRPEVYDRLLTMHLNDVKELSKRKSPHVPCGTGAAEMGKVLVLLHEKGFKGRFTIEHGNWNHNYQEIRDTIKFFDDTTKKLAEVNKLKK